MALNKKPVDGAVQCIHSHNIHVYFVLTIVPTLNLMCR